MVALNGEKAEAEATGKVVVVLADRLRQQRGSLSVRYSGAIVWLIDVIEGTRVLFKLNELILAEARVGSRTRDICI